VKTSLKTSPSISFASVGRIRTRNGTADEGSGNTALSVLVQLAIAAIASRPV
jgi:hypothetical protein